MEPPLDRSTTWPYVDGEPGPFHYARNAHPVGVEAERQLGELDGGEALLFSSGMGATTALVLGLLSPGSTVALAQDAYYGTGVLLTELERWGLRHVLYDQTGPPPAGADLVWIEAPSNPLLTMPDFEAAAAHPGLVVCDATAATPVHLRPLERGCDLVLHSATKYLAGHHDVLLGAVVCEARRARRPAARAADAHRDRRGARRRLAAAARAEDARGPGRPPDRDGGDARRPPRRARGRPDRALPGLRRPALLRRRGRGEHARRVETSTKLIANATSLGGVSSTLESRHRWEGDRVPAGLLRLAVGLEPADDLWRDLQQALENA